MKQCFSNKTEEHNTVLNQHSASFNIGTVNSAILNSATMHYLLTIEECKIK